MPAMMNQIEQRLLDSRKIGVDYLEPRLGTRILCSLDKSESGGRRMYLVNRIYDLQRGRSEDSREVRLVPSEMKDEQDEETRPEALDHIPMGLITITGVIING